MAEIDYEVFCLWQDTGPAELANMREQVATLERRPTISLLLPAGDLDEIWLRDGLSSLQRQVYPDWEVCLCQRGTRARIADLVPTDEGRARRVRTITTPAEAPSTAQAIEATLEATTGEYVAVLGEGDELAPEALFRVVERLQRGEADILYTDEDRIDHLGRRSRPIFKPGWSPDLLLTRPYLGRLCVIRRELLLDRPGGSAEGLGRMAEYGAMLRAAERAAVVAHIPGILHHRRAALTTAPTDAVAPPNDDPDLAEAVQRALARRGEAGRVRVVPGRSTARVIRELDPRPPVSIIVQTSRRGGSPGLLRQLSQGSGAHEVIAVSREPIPRLGVEVIADRSPARGANRAAERATGDVLVFVDGHGSIQGSAGSGWLAELVSHAVRSDVGAVSGRLMNTDGTVRHGGTAVDLEGLGQPAHHPLEPDDADLLMLRDVLNPGAASEELMAVESKRFHAVGGFDADHLSSRFLGLDLAFRLEDRGWRAVYTPYSVFACREQRAEPTPEELAHMWRRWSPRLSKLTAERWPPVDRRHRRPAVTPPSEGVAMPPTGGLR